MATLALLHQEGLCEPMVAPAQREGQREGPAGSLGRGAVGEASLLPSPWGDKASPHPLTLSGWA